MTLAFPHGILLLMLRNFLIQIVAAIGGLWIANRFLEGVLFTGDLPILVAAGVVLGLGNAVLKPVLNLVTFPIRLLTLGLSGLLIMAALVWGLDILFPELVIEGIIPLFGVALIVWASSVVLSLLWKNA